MKRLTFQDLRKVAFRLSLLQSTWFEGGMQSIGLAYCLIPGLHRLYPGQKEFKEAIERYKEPFNTHPFMAGVIAGAILHMEENSRTDKEIVCFYSNSMGLLAAFGDPFFRSALPIFVTAFSCLAAMLAGVAAGIITLLLLFNMVHFTVRFGGIYLGYRDGCEVMPRVANWLSPKRTQRINQVSAIAIGLVLATSVLTFGKGFTGICRPAAIASISGVLAGLALAKWRPSQQFAIPAVLVIVLLAKVSI